MTLVDRLSEIVGATHVTVDAAERTFLSRDFFYWDGAGTAALAAAPGDVAELQAVVRVLAQAEREVVIRGGGMSTGRSYVPNTDEAVLLDLRRLNRVREINVVDRYVVVEAGCTWSALLEALAPHGMRPDFTIPLSGSVSTVGGAMAHNVTGGMKGVLGLEVVRANGEVLRTGSWARAAFPEPYYRDYGPDLTGLFLGDTGAFGIKTAVSLHLSRPTTASAFASFTFPTMAAQTRAMVELSALDFLTMRSAFDPYLTKIVTDVRVGDGIRALGAVVEAAPSRLRGVVRAAKLLAGRRGLRDAAWSLHLCADQLTPSAARAGLAQARRLCIAAEGREIPATIAIGMGAGQLSVRGSLSKDGDRWIATNSIFPMSRAVAACAALESFLAARRAEFAAHDVKVGCFTTCSGVHFQAEPLFWWSDKVSELSLRNIDAAEAERFAKIPENAKNRAFITRTRHELRDFFEANGAIHVHTSKFFRYGALLMPATRTLLHDIKSVLDPNAMFNPGNLGL